MALNAHQKIAQLSYERGDMLFNGDTYKDVGDSLYTAIMMELSDREDCDSREAAINRMNYMREQVQQVITALENDNA